MIIALTEHDETHVKERAPANFSHKFISIDLHNVISGGNDRKKKFATREFNSVAVAYEMLNHCFSSHSRKKNTNNNLM